jgi:hypothetical protein
MGTPVDVVAGRSRLGAWWVDGREWWAHRLGRALRRVRLPLLLRRLRRANQSSRLPVVSPGGPVVSLTTHGERLANVYLTLESIARGRLRPSRLMLWLSDTLRDQPLPETLQRLQRRGLEVLYTPDVGPHTKYHPYVMRHADDGVALVTADDDLLYPAHWLERLQHAAQQHPWAVHCFRARRVQLDEGGARLRPYSEWHLCDDATPSALHMATGVSGVIYPCALQRALRDAGMAFADVCPRADDLWLHVMALRHGLPVRQLSAVPRSFYSLPGARQGLARFNVHGGGNDTQAAKAYTEADLARLRQAV